MIDQFYTPPELAHVLVGSVPKAFNPRVIADFAAGEGSLLRAAVEQWPTAQAVANDLSPAAVRSLKAERPRWLVSNANFMVDRSVRSSALMNWIGRVDLVLLNPPFSRRKRTPHPVVYKGETFGVSLAMAFVVRSLVFAHEGSFVLAVLPDGCLAGKCDERIWLKLKRDFHIEVLRRNSDSAFNGVRARTSLVSISRPRLERVRQALEESCSPLHANYVVKRGQQQMHALQPSNSTDALPLVHTTHLIGGVVAKYGPRVVARRHIRGPALLFPRVGKVTQEKICILESNELVVLSDCVLAIDGLSFEEVLDLRRAILDNWPVLMESYRGTGAPHTTIERTAQALARIKYVDSVKVGGEIKLRSPSEHLSAATSSAEMVSHRRKTLTTLGGRLRVPD